jgi:hypothetical protein
VTFPHWLLENFDVCVIKGATSIAREPMKLDFTKHIGFDASFMHSHLYDHVIALLCRLSFNW